MLWWFLWINVERSIKTTRLKRTLHGGKSIKEGKTNQPPVGGENLCDPVGVARLSPRNQNFWWTSKVPPGPSESKLLVPGGDETKNQDVSASHLSPRSYQPNTGWQVFTWPTESESPSASRGGNQPRPPTGYQSNCCQLDTVQSVPLLLLFVICL